MGRVRRITNQRRYTFPRVFSGTDQHIQAGHQSGRKWLEEAYRRAIEDGAKAAPILLDVEMARLRMESGDLSAAVEWRDHYKVSSDDPVSVYQLFVYIFLVRVLMETGKIQEARALSERLLQIAVKGHRPMDALELKCFRR